MEDVNGYEMLIGEIMAEMLPFIFSRPASQPAPAFYCFNSLLYNLPLVFPHLHEHRDWIR
jgi:hypothetical protein